MKLKISNIDYLTPDSAVITALRKLKIQLVTDIMYECYRDNEGNLLKTKNGSRFIFIVRPTTFFAQTVSIGEETAYLSYKGMEKDMEHLLNSQEHNDSDGDKTTSSASNNSSAKSSLSAQTRNDEKSHGQKFMENFFPKKIQNQPQGTREPSEGSRSQAPEPRSVQTKGKIQNVNTSDNLDEHGDIQQNATLQKNLTPATEEDFLKNQKKSSPSSLMNLDSEACKNRTNDTQQLFQSQSCEQPDHSNNLDKELMLPSTPIESEGQNNQILHEGGNSSIEDQTPTTIPSATDTAATTKPRRGRSLKKIPAAKHTLSTFSKASKKVTPEKNPIPHLKTTLTERRRTSSLKRKGDGFTSFFEKKNKNRNKGSLFKGDLVSLFSSPIKADDLTPNTAGNEEGSGEKHRIISEILNEILSRINY